MWCVVAMECMHGGWCNGEGMREVYIWRWKDEIRDNR